jgi:hypothetical protein
MRAQETLRRGTLTRRWRRRRCAVRGGGCQSAVVGMVRTAAQAVSATEASAAAADGAAAAADRLVSTAAAGLFLFAAVGKASGPPPARLTRVDSDGSLGAHPGSQSDSSGPGPARPRPGGLADSAAGPGHGHGHCIRRSMSAAAAAAVGGVTPVTSPSQSSSWMRPLVNFNGLLPRAAPSSSPEGRQAWEGRPAGLGGSLGAGLLPASGGWRRGRRPARRVGRRRRAVRRCL